MNKMKGKKGERVKGNHAKAIKPKTFKYINIQNFQNSNEWMIDVEIQIFSLLSAESKKKKARKEDRIYLLH
jgi:hypothetical protein